MKLRMCTRCDVEKELTEENFKRRETYAEGFHTWCVVCYRKYNADYQKNDRNARPEFYKAREFAREMKAYGTTVEWYRDKLIEQCGVCVICNHLSHHHGTLQRLQVDHSHACCNIKTKSCGKCLRGLLCADCNIRLAPVEDVLTMGTVVPIAGTWLSKALAYLDSYKKS